MLSIIFQATNQTQKPFLSRVLRGQQNYGRGMDSIANWISYLIREILCSSPDLDLKNRLLLIIESILNGSDLVYLDQLKTIQIHFKDGKRFKFIDINGNWAFLHGTWESPNDDLLNLNNISLSIKKLTMNSFQEFELRCKLQLINDLLYGNVIAEHINPLLKRIESKTYSMDKYLIITNEIDNNHFLEIISLKNLNQEAKQTMAIFISKMYFDFHKLNDNRGSFHLIIDEAHNILSYQVVSENESWRDYRLSIFEEIIKEGRKFGFF